MTVTVLKLHHSAPICRLWQGSHPLPARLRNIWLPVASLHDISKLSSTLLLRLCACINAPTCSEDASDSIRARSVSMWRLWCLHGMNEDECIWSAFCLDGERALHSFPKRAVLAGRLTACLSTWCGDWVWAVSFPLCLWNLGSCIFITCASVLGCYHRDGDKQNIKFKCLKILGLGSEDCAGLAPGLPTGVAQSPSCTRWKNPLAMNLMAQYHGSREAEVWKTKQKQVLLIILVKCAVTSHGCNIRLPLLEHLREEWTSPNEQQSTLCQCWERQSKLPHLFGECQRSRINIACMPLREEGAVTSEMQVLLIGADLIKSKKGRFRFYTADVDTNVLSCGIIVRESMPKQLNTWWSTDQLRAIWEDGRDNGAFVNSHRVKCSPTLTP